MALTSDVLIPVYRVAAIVGSLHAGSYNRALLRAAMELQPDGLEIVEASTRSQPRGESRKFPEAPG